MTRIIDNWRDLPVGVYLDILDVQKEPGEEIHRQAAILSLLTGMDPAEVLNLPLDEYRRLRGAAAFLAEPCPDDLLRIADKYPLGPLVLRPTLEYDKLTVAQYVDFQTFSKDPQKYLAELISVLVVPDGHKYGDGYDVKDVQAAIREWMNVADALALLAHFFAWSSSLIHNTPASFRLLAETKTPEERRLLKRLLKKMARTEATLSSFAGAGSTGWTP